MSTEEMQTALLKVKKAMLQSNDDFDDTILDLMQSALIDLNIAGVDGEQAVITDSAVRNAVITYCKMNFGTTPDNYADLKASYDEQKAQLSMATNYTVWSE